MNFQKKFFICCFLFFSGAILYLAGIYITGIGVDRHLSDLNHNLKTHSVDYAYSDSWRYRYTKKESGFFTEKGILTVSYPNLNFSIPVKIEKGFFYVTAYFDEDIVKQTLIKYLNMPLKYDELDFLSYISASFFYSGTTLYLNFNAPYYDKKGEFSFNSSFEFYTNGDLNADIECDNLHTILGAAAKHLTLNYYFEDDRKADIFKNLKFYAEDFSFMNLKGDLADIEVITENIDKTGRFDLNFKGKFENIDGLLKSADADLTFSRFNSEYFYDLFGNISMKLQALKDLNTLKVNSLTFVPDQKAADSVGASGLSKLTLNGKGVFKSDIRNFYRIVDGEIIFESDSNENAESFLIEKDGRYISDIKVKNSKLYINGQKYSW